ncbi:MAG: hypothetical protein HY707_08675 [Ignavibacteriae bacterium]|nr:hypothetical protein [Ignavibacteriota bacterium]
MSEKKESHVGGIEGKMDVVATFYFGISISLLVICLIVSAFESSQKTGLSVFWLALGLISIAQGFISWILFRAGAEIIRLLKRLNNLPYGGEISRSKAAPSSIQKEPQQVNKFVLIEERTSSKKVDSFFCNECKTEVPADATECPKCGTIF